MIPDAYDKNTPKRRREEPGGYRTRGLLAAGRGGEIVKKKPGVKRRAFLKSQ